MNRIWLFTGTGVVLVAAFKTALATRFLLPSGETSAAVVAGLFVVFLTLTSVVVYAAFFGFREYFEQILARRSPASDSFATKEGVIAQRRLEWGLSNAESDVALFVAKGFSNAEIAEMRGCAIATVKSQIGSIFQKSGLETRYQLMALVTDEVCEIAQTREAAPQPNMAQSAAPETPAKTTKNVWPLVSKTKPKRDAAELYSGSMQMAEKSSA